MTFSDPELPLQLPGKKELQLARGNGGWQPGSPTHLFKSYSGASLKVIPKQGSAKGQGLPIPPTQALPERGGGSPELPSWDGDTCQPFPRAVNIMGRRVPGLAEGEAGASWATEPARRPGSTHLSSGDQCYDPPRLRKRKEALLLLPPSLARVPGAGRPRGSFARLRGDMRNGAR